MTATVAPKNTFANMPGTPAPIGERTDFPLVCAHVFPSELQALALQMRPALPIVTRHDRIAANVQRILDELGG